MEWITVPQCLLTLALAAEMSVHGLRSYYITVLTQMRARKPDRERVSRWRPGSAMADHFDAVGGTAELMVRKLVADAVKYDWRLSPTRCR